MFSLWKKFRYLNGFKHFLKFWIIQFFVISVYDCIWESVKLPFTGKIYWCLHFESHLVTQRIGRVSCKIKQYVEEFFHNTFSVWHLQIIPKNFSNSHSITSPSGFCQSSSSSLASKSHSLLCRLQKLWSTAHATITLESRATLASSIKDNVRHRPFTIPNVHPTLTLAADNCLLNWISLGSLVPSG